MKITKQSVYGIQFIIRLAEAYDIEYIKINQVAKSENISGKFLESIASKLKANKLLLVKRGSKGGYMLAMPPAEITLRHCFEALNDPLVQVDDADNNELAVNSIQLVTSLWEEINVKIFNYLENKTVEELLTEYKELNSDQMFYI